MHGPARVLHVEASPRSSAFGALAAVQRPVATRPHPPPLPRPLAQAENLPNAQWIEVGGVKLVDAIASWWEADEGAEFLDFAPCEWSERYPHQCNPTCHSIS